MRSVTPQEMTDETLLTEFLAQRGEAPFEELVRRYGPLVYGVCLSTLNHAQDAEDATQAVFLTLALKSAELKGRANLGGWLHRTAWNVARRARTAVASKKDLEQEAGRMTERGAEPDDAWRELQPLLDEELDKLPEKFRLPLVLHHLEGRTKDETARLLNENPGTIAARLDRARERLREQLVRRGVTISSGAVSALLLNSASTALPPGLALATAKSAAMAAAAGKLSAGVASGQVLTLAKGSVGAMGISKTTVAVLLVLALGLGSISLVVRNRLLSRTRRQATRQMLISCAVAADAYEFDWGDYPPDTAPNGAKSSGALAYYLATPFRIHPNGALGEVQGSKDSGPYMDLGPNGVLKQPDDTVVMVDPWGQPFEYKRLEDSKYDLFSKGEPGANKPIFYNRRDESDD